MKELPNDFAGLLSARGRRILEGRDRAVTGALGDPRQPFLAIDGALDRDKAAAVWRLLDRALGPHLVPLSQPIPPESITGQTRNYEERLRKTVRNRTAYLERRGSKAWRAAESIGLVALTGGDSYRRFVEIVAGQAFDDPNQLVWRRTHHEQNVFAVPRCGRTRSSRPRRRTFCMKPSKTLGLC